MAALPAARRAPHAKREMPALPAPEPAVFLKEAFHGQESESPVDVDSREPEMPATQAAASSTQAQGSQVRTQTHSSADAHVAFPPASLPVSVVASSDSQDNLPDTTSQSKQDLEGLKAVQSEDKELERLMHQLG